MEKVIMYEQIYKDIIKGIQDGIYKGQDLLPSEKDLAVKYGVSRITTSKAMNLLAKEGLIDRVQGRGSFVSQKAAELLKNRDMKENAEDVSAGTADMIGVIVDSFGVDFGCELLKGIERECHKSNLDMFFRCTFGNIEEENDAIHRALAHGARGLILLAVQGEKYNDTVLKMALNKFPVVLVDREMKGIGIPCIKTDNYAATWEMTEELIKRGHRKICLVTHESDTTPTIEDRCNAFRDCVLEHQNCQGTIERLRDYLSYDTGDINEYVDYDMSQVKEIILKEKECSAFFAVEYKIGVLLTWACAELGLKKDVCTFDGLNGIFAGGHHFPHVKQDEYQMGREAVRTLKQVIEGKNTELIINIPHKIVL